MNYLNNSHGNIERYIKCPKWGTYRELKFTLSCEGSPTQKMEK